MGFSGGCTHLAAACNVMQRRSTQPSAVLCVCVCSCFQKPGAQECPHTRQSLTTSHYRQCLTTSLRCQCLTLRLRCLCLTPRLRCLCITPRLRCLCLTPRLRCLCLTPRLRCLCLARSLRCLPHTVAQLSHSCLCLTYAPASARANCRVCLPLRAFDRMNTHTHTHTHKLDEKRETVEMARELPKLNSCLGLAHLNLCQACAYACGI